MKSKLHLRGFATVLALFLSVALAGAQINSMGGPSATPTFDPATGLPVPDSSWKDPNWKDPDIILTNAFYDNLPLSEIAHALSDQFKEQFDILLPGTASSVTSLNGQPVSASWQSDWRSEQVQLRLKNVTASEIFGAMNLLFENNRTPLRWELKANGHRQIALLRVLIDPTPQNSSQPGANVLRRIYFVGDLIGDEKSGGMTMNQIMQTILDIWKMADTTGGNIQFHEGAQLLVVTGTPGQIDFMEQTLSALRQKVGPARRTQTKIDDLKTKLDVAKPAGTNK